MSVFKNRWQEAQLGKRGQGEDWDHLRQAWPTLADALLGKPSQGEEPGWPPCKILIFTEADKLKFMLSPLVGDLVAFGTVSDPLQGFDGIEAELAGGRFEWKKRRR